MTKSITRKSKNEKRTKKYIFPEEVSYFNFIDTTRIICMPNGFEEDPELREMINKLWAKPAPKLQKLIEEEFKESDSNFNEYSDYLDEFEKTMDSMKWNTGIEDVSSSKELVWARDIIAGWSWVDNVATPEDIKKHILEDMANIRLFKGKITPEDFGSEVKEHLEDLYKAESIAFYSNNRYIYIDDFAYDPDELGVGNIIPCGGVITGKNRYIYCFYDSVEKFFFGKEFFVDEKGTIHEGTTEWMFIGNFRAFGKSDFWNMCHKCDQYGEAPEYYSYVPGLIALYSMAKFVNEIRNKNTVDKAA